MPKGIYEKRLFYRRTEKLDAGIPILQAHDPHFKMQDRMTNEDVYDKLRDFGFKYGGGRWYKMSRSNGHTPDAEPEVTIKPVGINHLEVVLSEDELGRVQDVIDAMLVLNFTVEVWVIGTKE